MRSREYLLLVVLALYGESCGDDASPGPPSSEELAKAEERRQVLEQVSTAFAQLGDQGTPEQVAAACEPAAATGAMSSDSEISRTCAEAYLALGHEAVSAGDEAAASQFLARARSSGIEGPDGNDLGRGIRELSRQRAAQERADSYMERIDRELDGLGNFDVSRYVESRDSIILGAALFSAWAQIADEARQHELREDQQRKVGLFKRRVTELQIRSFSKLRDAFGPAIRKALWEHDMEASTFGSGYSTIQFTGGAFAANRNIKEFQSGVSELLHQLRFRQARYRWYKGASEYTYFDLSSPSDSELIIWREGGRFVRVD